jgi:hypothetical protein
VILKAAFSMVEARNFLGQAAFDVSKLLRLHKVGWVGVPYSCQWAVMLGIAHNYKNKGGERVLAQSQGIFASSPPDPKRRL